MAIGGPSWQDIYDVGLAALGSRRSALVVRPGDVTDAYLCGGATMANIVIGSAAKGFRATLVLGAQGDDLTVVCHDRGVDRDEGDKAVGTVTFTRPSSGASGTIPAGTRVAPDPDSVTGQFPTFTTDHDLTFGTADLSLSVTCTATVVGKDGNVDVAEVARCLDTLFDTTFTVTNGNKFAGGSEPEADDDLQARTMSYPLVLRRGTEDALEYAAKLANGVKRAAVTRDSSTGIVSVYICDADGNANAALASAAATIIEGPPAWRSAGDVVNVYAAALYTQDLQLSLQVRTGVDVNALLARVTAAVTARMRKLKPGETLYRTMISTAAEQVDPQSIVSCTVVSPAADVVPTTSQAIRAGVITYP